jgi:fibronectin type 3 domain-containing protein
VERSTDGVNFSQIASLGASVATYSSTGLAASTQYTYRVRATNSAGNSAYSNTATAATQSPAPTPPTAPSGLTATAVSSAQINLTWVDNSNNETGFKIERSTDGVNFTQIALISGGLTAYSSTGLTASTQYTFRVRATNTAGDSGYSNTKAATTSAPAVTTPTAPTGLAATAVSSVQVNLSWSDNSNNETGFKIERSTGGGAFTQVAIASANVTQFVDTGLTANTQYAYRIRATNAAGDSSYTSVASAATPLTAPAVPSNLTASAAGATQIDLTWTDNSGGQAQFVVERQVAGGAFAELTVLPVGTTSFSDVGLLPATTYTYMVFATNSGGDSAESNAAGAVTAAPTPAQAATTDITLGGTGPKFVRFIDADGTVSIISFHGTGTLAVHFSGDSISSAKSGTGTVLTGNGMQIASITTTGSNSRSFLSMTGRGGDGSVTIGGMNIDGGFGTISAKMADLVGDLNATGGITNLTLRGIRGGVLAAPAVTHLIAGGDFADDVHADAIGTFRSASISQGTWTVTGNVTAIQVLHDVSMHLSAATARSFIVGGSVNSSNLTFTLGVVPKVFALGSMIVRGTFNSSVVSSAGNIGTIAALGLNDSQLYAGVSTLSGGQDLPSDASQLDSASIKKLTLRAIRGMATNAGSSVAAASIGTANLGTLQLSNGGVPFGVAARSIGSLAGVDVVTGKHLSLHKLATGADTSQLLAAQGVTPGDLVIRLL